MLQRLSFSAVVEDETGDMASRPSATSGFYEMAPEPTACLNPTSAFWTASTMRGRCIEWHAGELSRDTVFYSEPDNRGTDLASAFSVASVCTCEIVAKRQLTIGPTLRHEE